MHAIESAVDWPAVTGLAAFHREWQEAISRAIALAHWLEAHPGAPDWHDKKAEFEMLVKRADVLKEFLR